MQAIKDLVLHQLNAHVSPYVENLNAQDLSFSVFSGKYIRLFLCTYPTVISSPLRRLPRHSLACSRPSYHELIIRSHPIPQP